MSEDNPSDDLDTTSIRKFSLKHRSTDEGTAEAVYRSVELLRNLLPTSVQRELAVCFEWARVAIDQRVASHASAELEALRAAYAFARDEMRAAVTEDDE
ncbi:MAG TPA: hypothetical protein VEZ88_14485 [Steroidobacteraceae bacterium]|nr:hypothetical protein [Steroidobacteraceae bacterium]